MRIILDGMGGDNAPEEIVKGAVQAAAEIDHEIIIVGKPEAIKEELKRNKYSGNRILIEPAEEVITMEDSPVKAIRRKRKQQMKKLPMISIRLLKALSQKWKKPIRKPVLQHSLN